MNIILAILTCFIIGDFIISMMQTEAYWMRKRTASELVWNRIFCLAYITVLMFVVVRLVS